MQMLLSFSVPWGRGKSSANTISGESPAGDKPSFHFCGISWPTSHGQHPRPPLYTTRTHLGVAGTRAHAHTIRKCMRCACTTRVPMLRACQPAAGHGKNPRFGVCAYDTPVACRQWQWRHGSARPLQHGFRGATKLVSRATNSDATMCDVTK